MLAGHEPYPAIAVDRDWNLMAEQGAGVVLREAATHSWGRRDNVMKLALHPDGWRRGS